MRAHMHGLPRLPGWTFFASNSTRQRIAQRKGERTVQANRIPDSSSHLLKRVADPVALLLTLPPLLLRLLTPLTAAPPPLLLREDPPAR